jgi:hypothetical protein
VLDTGDKADFITPDLKYSEINMKISIVREYDLIIPRSHSVIRHECKKILNNKDQSAKTDMDSKQTESIQDTKDVKDVENNKENIK